MSVNNLGTLPEISISLCNFKALNSRKPILVTGSHRSGTTYVGRMIAEHPSIAYIHEPFNIQWCHSGICSAKFPYWFTYITEKNEVVFYEHIKNTIAFRYNISEELKSVRNIKDVALMIRDYHIFTLSRFRKLRPLIKDPIALFSAEWLASKFDMDVTVLIRHPAAFTYSLKKKNWIFKFSNFLEQPLLMKDYLYPFEKEIREYAEKEHDIVDQAALLWNIIHFMIAKYMKKHADWIFLRHEDIARDPLRGFQSIFNKLDIEFSEQVRDVIKKYSCSTNPVEQSKGSKSLKRDSKSTISIWRNHLTISEIDRIRSKVENIAKIFYSDEDW